MSRLQIFVNISDGFRHRPVQNPSAIIQICVMQICIEYFTYRKPPELHAAIRITVPHGLQDLHLPKTKKKEPGGSFLYGRKKA